MSLYISQNLYNREKFLFLNSPPTSYKKINRQIKRPQKCLSNCLSTRMSPNSSGSLSGENLTELLTFLPVNCHRISFTCLTPSDIYD